MTRAAVCVCALSALLVRPALSQHRVDARNMYERVYCIVPLVGTGTWDDPKRPKYVLPSSERDAASRKGILGFAWQPSDDGKFALVVFVAQDKTAFEAILADSNPDIKIFNKGKQQRGEIAVEFQKYKKGFDPDSLRVTIP